MITAIVGRVDAVVQGAIDQWSPTAGERSLERGGRALAMGRERALAAGAAGVAAAVVAVCAVSLGQRVLLQGTSLDAAAGAPLLRDLLAACSWIPVGVGVVWLARRAPLRGWRDLVVGLPVHAAGIGAAALGVNVLTGASWMATGLWPDATPFGDAVLRGTLGHLHANALLYALIVAATSARARTARIDRPALPDRIAVPDRGRTILLDVDRIDWVEAAGDYVSLHAGSRAYLVAERMRSMEERLGSGTFVRTHRSAIVNLEKVREVRPEPAGNATLLLRDGTAVPLSRRRRTDVEARLGV